MSTFIVHNITDEKISMVIRAKGRKRKIIIMDADSLVQMDLPQKGSITFRPYREMSRFISVPNMVLASRKKRARLRFGTDAKHSSIPTFELERFSILEKGVRIFLDYDPMEPTIICYVRSIE